MTLIDIVDKKGNVIGKEGIDVAHKKRLLHRVVHVFVVSSDGLLLLQVRGKNMKRGPLLYDASAGGHVDSGETYEQAAKKELMEELGIEVNKVHFNHNFIDDGKNENALGKCFVVIYDGEIKFNEEVEHVSFYTIEEISYLIDKDRSRFTNGFLKSFEEFCRTL